MFGIIFEEVARSDGKTGLKVQHARVSWKVGRGEQKVLAAKVAGRPHFVDEFDEVDASNPRLYVAGQSSSRKLWERLLLPPRLSVRFPTYPVLICCTRGGAKMSPRQVLYERLERLYHGPERGVREPRALPSGAHAGMKAQVSGGAGLHRPSQLLMPGSYLRGTLVKEEGQGRRLERRLRRRPGGEHGEGADEGDGEGYDEDLASGSDCEWEAEKDTAGDGDLDLDGDLDENGSEQASGTETEADADADGDPEADLESDANNENDLEADPVTEEDESEAEADTDGEVLEAEDSAPGDLANPEEDFDVDQEDEDLDEDVDEDDEDLDDEELQDVEDNFDDIEDEMGEFDDLNEMGDADMEGQMAMYGDNDGGDDQLGGMDGGDLNF